MRILAALLTCAAIAFACGASAQSKSPPFQGPPPKDTKSGLLAKPELKQDARTESCNREATAKNLRGEARENFMTQCLK